MDKPYLSIAEAERLLGISRHTIYRYIYSGRLRAYIAKRKRIANRNIFVADMSFKLPEHKIRFYESTMAYYEDREILMRLPWFFIVDTPLCTSLRVKLRKLEHLARFLFVPFWLVEQPVSTHWQVRKSPFFCFTGKISTFALSEQVFIEALQIEERERGSTCRQAITPSIVFCNI